MPDSKKSGIRIIRKLLWTRRCSGLQCKGCIFCTKIYENRSRHRKDLGIIDRGLCGVYDLEPHLQIYVITITNFDPFGYDYMMYQIDNQCREVPELSYEDGLQFIYFYTKGKKGGTADIQAMLKYFEDSTEANATTDAIKAVHSYVSRVKVLPEVRQEYMKFDEIMYYAKRDGKIEARVQSILELLEDYGEIPEEVRQRLEGETNLGVLKEWHKIAARAQSIQEFVDKIDAK